MPEIRSVSATRVQPQGRVSTLGRMFTPSFIPRGDHSRYTV
jgi:hypothetical protein